MPDKIVLTDADGVLLDWSTAFDRWMEHVHGHEKVPGGDEIYRIGDRFDISQDRGFDLVCEFNNSTEILAIRPLRDAQEYVSKLHDLGYVLHVITSLSDQPRAHEFRLLNLETIFGKAVIDRLICLDTGADKDQALSEYADSGFFWIEDKISNANAGLEQGLKPILVDHPYNKSQRDLDYPRVTNWSEIYQLVTAGHDRRNSSDQ